MNYVRFANGDIRINFTYTEAYLSQAMPKKKKKKKFE